MKKNRSIFIIPISIIAHLIIINSVFVVYNGVNSYKQVFFITVFWLFISYYTKVYDFNRFTKLPKLIRQLLFQYSVFTLAYISYYALFDVLLNAKRQMVYLGIIFTLITLFRAIYFYTLRKYRLEGYNFRNVIVIGLNNNANSLIRFFNKRKDFGCHYKGYFDNIDTQSPSYLGNVDSAFDYIKNNDIDEIYCSLSNLPLEKVTQFIEFCDDNLKTLKLIPKEKTLYSKVKLEYYEFVPVLSVRELPFEKPVTKFIKRLFDILFSLLVLIFILSWLTPILYFLIKKESEGPVFFKQAREGIRGELFMCYKFRSMGVNRDADKIQASKGDFRITKIGSFLRKTSIDELPQFINVLKGEMSVVGPRPHMISQSDLFKKIVKKYAVRHFIKPGITGLAQVKGCRGEIEKEADIKNRVKFDIFYIENWSFILDIKIIYLTVKNILQGEDKAY